MDQLYTNRFGVQETIHDIPFLPEILLIPGLAFRKKGYRLGYGGDTMIVTLPNSTQYKPWEYADRTNCIGDARDSSCVDNKEGKAL